MNFYKNSKKEKKIEIQFLNIKINYINQLKKI